MSAFGFGRRRRALRPGGGDQAGAIGILGQAGIDECENGGEGTGGGQPGPNGALNQDLAAVHADIRILQRSGDRDRRAQTEKLKVLGRTLKMQIDSLFSQIDAACPLHQHRIGVENKLLAGENAILGAEMHHGAAQIGIGVTAAEKQRIEHIDAHPFGQ